MLSCNNYTMSKIQKIPFDFHSPQTKFAKVMFSQVFLCSQGDLCAGGLCPGGFCPRDLCPGASLFSGSLSRGPGVSVKGRGSLSRQGGLCPGKGSLSRQGGFCPGEGFLSRGGVSVQGRGSLSKQGGLCPGEGSLSRGGVSVQGRSFCPGEMVSVQGVSAQGESLSRGSLSRGVSLQGVSVQGGLCQEDPPHMVKSGRYASYWNAHLARVCQ